MSHDVDATLNLSQSPPKASASSVMQVEEEMVIQEPDSQNTVIIVPSLETVENTVIHVKEEKSHVDADRISVQSPPREIVIRQVASTVSTEQKQPTVIEGQLPQHIQQSIIQQQIPQGEFQMGSVLYAIASHLSKGRKVTVDEQVLELQDTQAGNTEGSPIIVTVPASSAASQSVPSSHNVSVSCVDNMTSEQVIQTVSSSSDLPYSVAKRPHIELADSSQEQNSPVYIRADRLPPGSVLQTIETENGIFHVTQVATVDSSKPAPALTEIYGPCPICGDRISGK